jgi:23S rRNA pseudouridine2605 synthase
MQISLKMPLNKYLAFCGFSSRRKAVRVNDAVVTEPGTVIDPDCDRVFLEDQRMEPPKSCRYIVLNKPMGAITSVADARGRKTVLDCITIRERIFPVGRLDYDTKGVLLLTNDGDLAYRLTHPRFGIEKVYQARVEGRVRPSVLEKLRKGVAIGESVRVNGEAEILESGNDESLLEIRIHEGKKRQVKRMMKSVGHPVIHLTRTCFAGITAGKLSAGEWRDLTEEEVARLYGLAGLKKRVFPKTMETA